MKNRDVKMRLGVKAAAVQRHDVIELKGQRIRCDRIRKAGPTKGIRVFTQLYNSGRVRHMRLAANRKVDVVRRGEGR